MNTKILITGDSGFLGQNLFKHLSLKGYDVVGCSRKGISGDKGYYVYATVDGNYLHYNPAHKHYGINLIDSDSVKAMLSHCRPDCIIHTAANALVRVDENNPGQIIDDNVKSTQILCHHAQNCRFIFMSSIIVYGGANCHEEEKCYPISIYGATKLASEYIIGCNKSLKSTIFRLGAVVGPGLTHGVVFDIMRKLRSESPTLDLLGDKPGSQKTFLHISDFLSAVDMAIDGKLDKSYYGSYNVCNEPHELVSVERIAEIVKKTMNIDKHVMWLGEGANWKGDNKVLSGVISEMNNAGWNTQLSSESAIEQAVRENL